jgi:putative transposase
MARTASTEPAVGTQLEMRAVVDAPLKRTWGGKRKGAGRKPATDRRRNVPHRVRELHKGRHPVHVTLRAKSGLPSLRHQLVSDMLRTILRNQRKRRYRNAFQVVEFSIQDNHLHLIVEAIGKEDAPDTLRSGVSGLAIAFAKRLNNMLRRRGKVWGDRWHGHELVTPREVRNVLVYVFRNLARHGTRMVGKGLVDPLSSASRFRHFTSAVEPIIEPESWPEAPPRTWLLGQGWRRHYRAIDPAEVQRTGE